MYIMGMTWIFLLAAEDSPLKTLAENSHDWIPFYGALLITLITAFFNLFKGQSRGRTEQFQVFMDESAQYREELRKEREILKKEVDALKVEKVIHQQQIADYDSQLDSCKEHMSKVQKQLDNATLSLDIMQEKLRRSQDI